LQSRLSSYASWASDKASSAWSSQSVQVGPVAVLNMCSQACGLVCCPGGFLIRLAEPPCNRSWVVSDALGTASGAIRHQQRYTLLSDCTDTQSAYRPAMLTFCEASCKLYRHCVHVVQSWMLSTC
jgi:hypothetical protein